MSHFFRGMEGDKYDRQYTDAYLIRRIASYIAKFRREVLTIGVSLIVLSFVASFQPVWIAQGVDTAEAEGFGSGVALLVAALLVTAVLQYSIGWIRRRLTGIVLGNLVAQLRKDAFAAAIDRDLAFYDRNKSGKVVSRITSDTQEFGDVMLIASDVVSQLISIAVLLVILLQRSVALTVILLLTLPFIVGMALGFRYFARIVTRHGSRAMALVNDNIQETVTGISVAKNFRQEAAIYAEFVEVNQQSFHTNMRRGFVIAMVFPALNVLTGIAIGVLLFVGAQHVVWGFIGLGAWYLFIQGVDRFFFPLINLAGFWSQFQQALSSTERIFALIDAENTIKQTDNQPVPALKGLIEFEDVTFQYDETTETVLKDFDLTIRPGESVAFVGHTGAGKSTIAKLIERFYEFQAGQIRIDGHDIRSFDLQSYRSKLGIVPQQPFLFSGTIIENIRYSSPKATDAEIEEIAYSIGNGEWLETMPDGLHSDVGERGARLSMGQRQLVALARVLLQRPAIFILDEATASVDPFTETQIQDALDMILAQSTSILIAHRLSTVRSADRIIVLKQGNIIEEGHHESLMEQGGHYAELYNTYFRHQSLDYIEGAREMLAQTAGD